MSCVEGHMRESMKDHVLEEFPAGERIRAFYLKHPGRGLMESCLILFTPEGVVLCGDRVPAKDGRATATSRLYDLAWFASELGEDYLCSKFMSKEWVGELAAKHCRQTAKEIRRGEYDDHTFVGVKKLAEKRTWIGEDLVQARRKLREGGPDNPEDVRDEIKQMREDLRSFRAQIVEKRNEAAKKFEELAQDTEDEFYGVERFAEELRDIDSAACADGVPGYGYPPGEAGWLCAIQQRFREVYHAQEPVTQ